MGVQIPLLVGMVALFYFMLIRPQQKQQREREDLLKALKKGDKVRTSGGILGEITELRDNEVILLIAEKTKINVLRTNIAGVEAPPTSALLSADKASSDKKASEKPSGS